MEIKIASECERALAYGLRKEVFIGEQNVPPEIELDGEDSEALHVIAVENGYVTGCARIIVDGKTAHIGRLAVKKGCRGKGVGSEICRFIIAYCRAEDIDIIWLNSQLHAVGFYERFGFVAEGESFFEAGIEHIKMVKS